MSSALNAPALMCGFAILLASAVGEAAVVYRTSGSACQIFDQEQGEFMYSPGGLHMFGNGQSAAMSCWLPTSDSTFTPATLSQVNVRYYSEAVATVAGRLYFHDYDGFGYVECAEEVDTVSTNGFRTLELAKTCLPIEYASDWGVMVVVEATNMTDDEYLNVRLLSAYD